MIRVVAAVAVLAVIVMAYLYGGSDTVRDQREDTLTRSKDIGDAINGSDNAPSWRDKLFSRDK